MIAIVRKRIYFPYGKKLIYRSH